MTADFAGNYHRVAISAPNLLVVSLKASYNKEWVERPEVRRKLEQVLCRRVGREVQLQFQVSETPKAARPERRQPQQSRVQRMREVEQDPLVQEAVKLFDAEVIRVDEKR